MFRDQTNDSEPGESDDETDVYIHPDQTKQKASDLISLENIPFIQRKPRRNSALENFYMVPRDLYAPLITNNHIYVSFSGKIWSGYNDRRIMGNYVN